MTGCVSSGFFGTLISHVVRPYLGVGVFDKETAARQGYQLNVDAGVYVVNITSGGPGDKAGLQRGDVILKIDDKAVNTVAELREAVGSHKIGESVTVSYQRNGKNQQVDVTLEEMPQADE